MIFSKQNCNNNDNFNGEFTIITKVDIAMYFKMANLCHVTYVYFVLRNGSCFVFYKLNINTCVNSFRTFLITNIIDFDKENLYIPNHFFSVKICVHCV